jgi:pyruvate dehydrogenase E1 component beta subunit
VTATETDLRTVNLAQAVNLALDEAMAADPSVILLGEDIADEEGGGVFRATAGLSSKYGTSRVRSTPISEQAIVGAALGAALTGLRPVAELMLMNFVAVAMDQIHNHLGKLRYMSGGRHFAPVTIRTAAGAGIQFGAQHSDMLEGWLAQSPGIKIAIPSTPADAKGLLTSCIFDDDPCVFVEHSVLYYSQVTAPDPGPGHRIPLGRANVVRPGSDLSIIGYGKAIVDAAAAAELLALDGIDVEVIDLRTIVPLDERTVLESVAKTKRALVVHESVQRYGVGGEIASRIHEELHSELAIPVRRLGAPSCPVPYSAALEAAYVRGAAEIEACVRTML